MYFERMANSWDWDTLYNAWLSERFVLYYTFFGSEVDVL